MILKTDILSKVTEKDIMCFYWGESIVDNQPIYKNPMRYDRNGTCYFKWKNGKYRLYDRAKDVEYNFDCFDYVMFLYGCSLYEALYRINDDMLIKATSKLLNSSQVIGVKKTNKRNINYQVTTRDWNEQDKLYWNQFDISIQTVNKIAKPVQSYSSDNGGLIFTKKYEYSEADPCYVYQFNKTIKLYRPYSKDNKWRSTITSADIFGINHLPHFGDTLYIVSGAKDMMCLWEMGLNSIAPQSESIDIPWDILNDLKCRFTNIIYLFDNDETGIKMSKQFAQVNELDYLILPEIDGAKDIAELVKKTSIVNTKSIILNGSSKRSISRTT